MKKLLNWEMNLTNPWWQPVTLTQTIVLSYNDADVLTGCFEARGRDIAAVIAEPAPANMGVVPPAPGFNATIREVSAAHGALMIADEVLTGFRVGPAGF